MGIENLPNDPDEIVDILARAEYLKIENENVMIKFENHNTINVQPKGTPFGAKLNMDEDPSLTFTFDSKKMRDAGKKFIAKDVIDNAIDDYLSGIGTEL